MRIASNSGSSFLAPPGHPTLSHHVEAGPRADPNLIAGLNYALDNAHGDVPATVRARVQALYDEASPVCSELWLAHVYGYFKNCYSPDGVDRSVSNCLIRSGDDLPPAAHHLACLLVREYFPDHEPREDLIASGAFYGSTPCIRCGATLQYEASVDAFAEAISARQDCPKGGLHEVDLPRRGSD